MRTVPVHNLRPNEIVWTPPVTVFFDTETRWEQGELTETHHFRCWSAELHVRRDKRKTVQREDSDHGVFASDLACVLHSWALKHPTIWAYAHNLAFDLSVSRFTTHMAELGWHVTQFAIDSPSPFVRMGNGKSVITFADSFSWLPVALDRISPQSQRSKLPLPANDGDINEWLRRCDSDVTILSHAMLSIMDWWDSNRIGKWSVTGSSSGWNAMRHRIDARRFTINTDPQGIAADRTAVYGGRRGQAVNGPQPRGTYADMDFTSAYPVVAASLPLPQERMARFTSLPTGHRWLTSDRHGVIARVRIKTSQPRWPVRHGRRVWYPVGEFWTDLAGPDIAEAALHGALCEIGPGYMHRLGYELKPWADWCLQLAAGADASTPEAVRLWAKHCGRAVIGKWAQRGFSTIPVGPAPGKGWHATEAWDHHSNVRAMIIDFDGKRWQATAEGNADNCYPAVLAWVESYVRVRLGRALDSLPAGSALVWDTDGILVDLESAASWTPPGEATAPLVMRAKKSYSKVEVTGPQHRVLDGIRQYAGIPASAEQIEPGRYKALLWPKMGWQMTNGTPGSYLRPQQAYRISSTYAPGWVLDDNTVIPVEMHIGASGDNQVTAWPLTSAAQEGKTLAESQNSSLERYRNETQDTTARQRNKQGARQRSQDRARGDAQA